MRAQDQACQPAGLTNCGATWDIEVIKKMVKESFEACKRQWKAAHDDEAGAKREAALLVNRLRSRRALVCLASCSCYRI